MYPNAVNMIVVPNNKKNGDCYYYPSLSYFVDGLWLWGKLKKEKIFLQIQSINIMYPNMENMIVVPTTKLMEIIMGVQVCLISQMNFDYKKNGGKKVFLANPKHQYDVSQCGEHDCHANN